MNKENNTQFVLVDTSLIIKEVDGSEHEKSYTQSIRKTIYAELKKYLDKGADIVVKDMVERL